MSFTKTILHAWDCSNVFFFFLIKWLQNFKWFNSFMGSLFLVALDLGSIDFK